MIDLTFSVVMVVVIFIVLSLFMDDEHGLLKLFLLISAFTLLIFVPKSAVDLECFPVVANATVSGSTTSYDYISECIPKTDSSTAHSFYNQYLWIYRFIWIYVFIFVFWKAYSNKDLLISNIRKWKK